MSAALELQNLLNGPVLAGVGATVDAGLTTDQYHVLPWNPKERVKISVTEGDGKVVYSDTAGIVPTKTTLKAIVAYAKFNIDSIFELPSIDGKAVEIETQFKTVMREDMTRILALSMAYGYYGNECREATNVEKKEIDKIAVSDDDIKALFTVDGLNRAATLVLARMHTKYQTNHAIGGNPMQASMASSVRAFYAVSGDSVKTAGGLAKANYITKTLYWSLHPLNETLLIPAVIQNSKITHSMVHKRGPVPTSVATEEYFSIRAHTPPASSHHFYVAAAAIKTLKPMGILPYIPEPSRIEDILAGLEMISLYGAQLHPAARFWGLERVTCNQKIVETICADLGYAIKKLMPISSLAKSPILQKEDALDTAWKTLIDNIRATIDERGKDLMSKEVFESIRKTIAPIASELPGLLEIDQYLKTGSVGDRQALPAAEEAEEQAEDPEEDSGSDSDSDDDNQDDPGQPPAGSSFTAAPAPSTPPPKPQGGSPKSTKSASPTSQTQTTPPKA
jgi:hypothetical protein